MEMFNDAKQVPAEGPKREWTAGHAEILDQNDKEVGRVPAWGETARRVTKRGASVELALEICRNQSENLRRMGVKPGYKIKIGTFITVIKKEYLPYWEEEGQRPYDELKAISDDVYAGKRKKYAQDVLDLLESHGIRRRRDDGALHEVNFSIARDRNPEILVVGLRYQKRDGNFTEDTFLFEEGKKEIERCYKGVIEEILEEYKGTHHGGPCTPPSPDPRE